MSQDTKNILKIIAAALVPPVVGTLSVYISATVLGVYGWTLFVWSPAVMGFIATMIYAPRGGKSYIKCLGVGLLYILVIAISVMAAAIEGLICVAMALPIAVPLTALGVLAAWLITNKLDRPRAGLPVSVFLLLTIPFTFGFEISNKSQPTMHQVVSTIEIDAPIDVVWKNVIEFPQIEKRPEGILNLGFAYPINAKIEGTGVGAVRNCNFDTGPFVEPITAWDAPNLLAFDVKEQPAPMTELTPYEHLHAAHLQYIRSQKGQFRLFEQNGRTVVEGTTFYTHDIAPDIYWRLFSDQVIHQIHMRVLEHIKKVSERRNS